jgi:hypothetical protein
VVVAILVGVALRLAVGRAVSGRAAATKKDHYVSANAEVLA